VELGAEAPGGTGEDESSQDESSDSDPRCAQESEVHSPMDHLRHAKACGYQRKPDAMKLTQKQQFLIQELSKDPMASYNRVHEELEKWRSCKKQMMPNTKAFLQSLDKDLQGTVGKLDPFLLTAMLEAAGHKDKKYVQDLLAGFPVTGEVPCCGTGTPIPGGQRVHGKTGNGEAPPLDKLQEHCSRINSKTLRRARARAPRSEDEWSTAWATWKKVQSDLEADRIGAPAEIGDTPLDKFLLVDTFGVWEMHGESKEWKIRVINDFRANSVNDFAWMPEKLSYNGFHELVEAASLIHELTHVGSLLGKADFKSAFKTLPPNTEQKWLCYALVFNPELARHQVVQLKSQAFGSLGGVISWYRTAMMIQTVMEKLFGLVIFIYVDDCFWIVPRFTTPCGKTSDDWVADVFEEVVSDLLGWKLDPEKRRTGSNIVLLGLDVRMRKEHSEWRLHDEKAKQWCDDIRWWLAHDRLTPADASKLCGRLAFLNGHIFNRMGRALVRPIIWRQRDEYGCTSLTPRLRWSLEWFMTVLQRRWCRRVPFTASLLPKEVILYSDAESTGHLAAVAVTHAGSLYSCGRVPARVRRMLTQRRTNIIAFELIAAVFAVVVLCPDMLSDANILHFIDCQPALSCVIKGHSRKVDLMLITGRLWFEAGILMSHYRPEYVASGQNLADGPSRHNFGLMEALGAECVPWSFPLFHDGLDAWMHSPAEANRLLV